jgi:hypothetical protein
VIAGEVSVVFRKKVFELSSSVEEGRPQIDFTLEQNRRLDWLKVDKILRGLRDVSEWETLSIASGHPGATAWDCFMDTGLGLFSQRAVEAIGYDAFGMFDLMDAKLDGEPHYFLRPNSVLDCLDRDRSELVFFPHDPSRVMKIRRYSFRDVPRLHHALVFRIPESLGRLFATEPILRRIEDHHLRGLQMIQINSDYQPAGRAASNGDH